MRLGRCIIKDGRLLRVTRPRRLGKPYSNSHLQGYVPGLGLNFIFSISTLLLKDVATACIQLGNNLYNIQCLEGVEVAYTWNTDGCVSTRPS